MRLIQWKDMIAYILAILVTFVCLSLVPFVVKSVITLNENIFLPQRTQRKYTQRTLMQLKRFLTILISAVWFINGFFCKILNLVPRHEMIVARITGSAHAHLLTILIGISETLMAVWILSRKYHRLNAVVQIIIIATMNTLEFFLAPDLLLWGRMNAVFALILITLIWYNELLPDKSLKFKV